MRVSRQESAGARAGGRSALVLLVLLAAVGLAACGSNPTPPPSTPPTSTSTAPASSQGASATPAPAAATGAPSGSTASAAGDGSVDACALLPTALLSGILGGETAFPKAVPGGGWAASQCAWSGPTSSFLARIGTAATITAFGDPAAPDAKAMLAAFRKQAETAGTTTDVPDVGDGAVLGPNGVAAYVGDTYLEVTRLRLTDDQLVQILQMAVANL